MSNADSTERTRPGSPFASYEVAFRVPGQSWKRRTIKNRTQEDRFFTMIDDEAAEVRYADEG